jgi:hypothetical protein
MAAATRLATRSLHHRKEEGVARQRGMPLISKESGKGPLRQREIMAVVVKIKSQKIQNQIQKQIS